MLQTLVYPLLFGIFSHVFGKRVVWEQHSHWESLFRRSRPFLPLPLSVIRTWLTPVSEDLSVGPHSAVIYLVQWSPPPYLKLQHTPFTLQVSPCFLFLLALFWSDRFQISFTLFIICLSLNCELYEGRGLGLFIAVSPTLNSMWPS